MITLRIGNNYTDIIGELPSSEYRKLERKLSFRPAGYQFSPAFNQWIIDPKTKKRIRRFWDGWKKQCWRNKTRTYFTTGLLSIALESLKDDSVSYSIQDTRVAPSPDFPVELSGHFVFRDYQKKIIDTACNRSRGIIQAATGSGKTVIASGIIEQLKVAPFIFFVTSRDLLTQAKNSIEMALLNNGSKMTVGQIGAGVVDIQDVNVMTIQTAVRALGKKWDKQYKFDGEDQDDKTELARYREDIKDLIRSAKGSICDEVQHWRADTCQLVSKELKSAYYTFGMSATPYRDEGDDLLIMSCFGRKIGEITASQLIREGWLVRPDIKMIHVRDKKSKFKQIQSIYKEQVVENERYNAYVSNIANAYIKEGRLVLVLVQQIKHGQLLQDTIEGSIFLSGSSPKKQREGRLNDLRNKEISCIISTNIFDEGIDVRPLDTVILAGQGKSKVRAMQRVGRVLRPYEDESGKKEKATVIDFCIHQKYLEAHATAREKMYRTEPEFIVDDIDPKRDKQ